MPNAGRIWIWKLFGRIDDHHSIKSSSGGKRSFFFSPSILFFYSFADTPYCFYFRLVCFFSCLVHQKGVDFMLSISFFFFFFFFFFFLNF